MEKINIAMSLNGRGYWGPPLELSGFSLWTLHIGTYRFLFVEPENTALACIRFVVFDRRDFLPIDHAFLVPALGKILLARYSINASDDDVGRDDDSNDAAVWWLLGQGIGLLARILHQRLLPSAWV